jgi:L-fuculose-phosphate aldolase
VRDDGATRAAICDVGARLWQKGLVSGNEGNLSVRVGPDRFLATPAGLSKGHLLPHQLVAIDGDGNPLESGTPSTEIRIHLEAYRGREDCHAVVHAHPPTGIAFTLSGESVPDDVLPEAAYVLGSVPTVPFGMPGTSDLSEQLRPFLSNHKTFLLSHHGALALGKDIYDACYRMECLESVCRAIFMARLMGRVSPMPSEALATFGPMAQDGGFR